jgi:intracellular sulfur oxidation DsrE/DsrF family protein
MNRRGFLATAATTAAASSIASAQSVPGGTHFVERQLDFDAEEFAKLVGRPAQIRQVFEAVAFRMGTLNNVKNSFNGLRFGFGYSAGGIAIALAGHGPSAVYGYSDHIWTKYRIGELLKVTDTSNAPIQSNVFLTRRAPLDARVNPDDEAGMYQDTSIETLQQRGLIVLTCHTAVEEQARAVVKNGFAPAGMTASQVADDMLLHLIPDAVVVPSMVAAIAVLQAKYGYTYLTPVL